MFYESFDGFAILSCQVLLIGNIELGIGITSWANILVNMIGFALKNTHAVAMEPIRAVFATDIEPETKKAKSKIREMT